MRTRNYWLFLLLSVCGAFVAALTYLCTTYLSAPPGDQASRDGILNVLLDPFVLVIALPFSIAAGLVVSPFEYFCLRNRELPVAFPIVLVSTLACVVAVTPWFGPLGVVAGFAGLVVSTLICSRIELTGQHR